jgi:hypothetical protein
MIILTIVRTHIIVMKIAKDILLSYLEPIIMSMKLWLRERRLYSWLLLGTTYRIVVVGYIIEYELLAIHSGTILGMCLLVDGLGMLLFIRNVNILLISCGLMIIMGSIIGVSGLKPLSVRSLKEGRFVLVDNFLLLLLNLFSC